MTHKPSPAVVALTGILTGVACIGVAMLAHHIEFPLPDWARESLTVGGVALMLGGAAGARFMPTKHEEKP